MNNLTICFYSVAEQHSAAIRPIYRKMKELGKDAVAVFNQPFKKATKYNHIVSSTAQEALPRAKNTIYHFHSLSPYHTNPAEQDYKHMKLFKAVMLPGSWWVNKWKNIRKSKIVGWPKSDFLFGNRKQSSTKTVLYASSMHDFNRMKTLKLLITLSKQLSFTLLVKAHGGTYQFYKDQYKNMTSELQKNKMKLLDPLSDITIVFPLADIVVSESSGVLWEFMATGRPSIHMKQGEKWGRVFPGGVLKADFNSLRLVIKKCFDNPDITKHLGWREKVMGEIDGKACLRAIKFIEETFH